MDENRAPDLKALRLSRGWTVSELSEKLEISLAAVYAWERGLTEPSYKSVVKLAKLYGLEPWKTRKHDYTGNPRTKWNTFAYWINENQRIRGMTTQQLAEESGISYSHLYNLKSGNFVPLTERVFVDLVCALYDSFKQHKVIKEERVDE